MARIESTVADEDGTLLLQPQQVLAALAYGLIIKDASEKLGWAAVSISRWREAIQRKFGMPVLLVLVQMLNEQRFDPALLTGTFIKDIAASEAYVRAVRALKRRPLTEDQIAAIIEAYPSYPRSTEYSWGSDVQEPEIRAILAQAGIRNPKAGSYALVVAAAAWLGQITVNDLTSYVKPVTVEFRHKRVRFTATGPPGTEVTVIINGEPVTVCIPTDAELAD